MAPFSASRSTQICPKLGPEGHSKDDCFFDNVLSIFSSFFGHKLGPCWAQVGIKIGSPANPELAKPVFAMITPSQGQKCTPQIKNEKAWFYRTPCPPHTKQKDNKILTDSHALPLPKKKKAWFYLIPMVPPQKKKETRMIPDSQEVHQDNSLGIMLFTYSGDPLMQ